MTPLDVRRRFALQVYGSFAHGKMRGRETFTRAFTTP